MNAMLFLSVVCVAAADAAPTPAAPPAQTAVSGTVSGCCSTPAPACGPIANCDPCSTRIGLFDKIRARIAGLKTRLTSSSCQTPCAAPAPAPCAAPAPAPCAAPAHCEPACKTRTPLLSHPLFTGFTSSTCNPCGRVSLLDKLRGLFHRHSCGCETAPVTTGCCGTANTPAVVAPAPTPPAPPKAMPKPVDPTPAPKSEPAPKKTTTSSLPLGGTTSSY